MKRHVVVPLMSYRDVDGVWRHASSGEDIDVDPGHVADFDRVNDPQKVSTRKPKPDVKQEPSPTSRRSLKRAAAIAAGREPAPKKAAGQA